MRKLIVTMFVTLDGVMEAPDKWSFPFWSNEIAKFKSEELFSSGALLLGRVTYDGFASAWPTQTDEEGFAERMNSLPKFVVSTTLQNAAWNNSTLIKTNIIEEIIRLKQQPGKDILIYGSGTLVNSLMQQNLIDQYQLLVYPIVLGSGSHLFRDGSKASLELVESKAYKSGVNLLVYQPNKKE